MLTYLVPDRKGPILANKLQPEGYTDFIGNLKARIQQTQVRAALAVSRELIGLYREIGRDLEQAITARNWGAKVIDQVAKDLKAAFPGVQGFSRSNLYRMRAFYQAYSDESAIVAQVVRQIPWGHNIVLLQKLKNPELRLWYAQKSIEHGWSRNILVMQIETKPHERQGKALTNFSQTLPPPQSDLAEQILKDPYNFDFLTLNGDAHERAVKQGLLEYLKQFLLELGVGFAFVGNQYHLEIDGDDFYIDLLFYHLKLRAFVVIELKARDFRPGDAGQLQMYVAAVDDMLRHESDQPTIGLILCQGKKELTVEYTLRGTKAPIGVADYLTTDVLPDDLKTDLPTVEDLEAELEGLEAKNSV